MSETTRLGLFLRVQPIKYDIWAHFHILDHGWVHGWGAVGGVWSQKGDSRKWERFWLKILTDHNFVKKNRWEAKHSAFDASLRGDSRCAFNFSQNYFFRELHQDMCHVGYLSRPGQSMFWPMLATITGTVSWCTAWSRRDYSTFLCMKK